MENKSIAIQSDEITKGIMSELEDEMTRALSRISRTMTEEVLDKLKPIEKKISDLKNDFEEVQEDNEDFVYKIDDLNKNIINIRKSIEANMEEAILKVIGDQSKAISEGLEKLLSSNEAISTKMNTMEENLESKILASTDNILRNINFDNVNDKIDIVEENLKNQIVENNKAISEKINEIDIKPMEDKVDSLWENIESLCNNNKQDLMEKFDNLDMSNIEEKLAILGVKVVKDAAKNKEEVLHALDNMNMSNLEEKMNHMELLLGSRICENEQNVSNKIEKINNKIGEKDEIIKLISKVENKVEVLQEEVEWGNKSIFTKIFGRRKY